ncbi:hypothetical protein FA15DRAFT_685231 [Coprinopsis marcescibilis]|uniref:CRAL-TRIO domain-containing protein n=1 Tax=Coprinopsis marcescibilis TaxID=230819 RepID=A0A5C3L758_COPMA|nr:hypothetical protein FA15DRAFT_685231 [Coprinopsis marcescibilis]
MASSDVQANADTNYVPLPGYVGNLTDAQRQCLDRLKRELKEEGKFVEERMDDAMLLRARKFAYDAVKEMLLSAEQWRVDFGVEDIRKNFNFKERGEVNKYYPQYYHNVDKDGRPVYIEQLGKLDIPALYQITTQERLLQHLVYEYEKCLSTRLKICSERAGHPVENFCTIFDLDGVGITTASQVKEFVSQVSGIGGRYPETMGKFYFINTPWGFPTFWMLIKGWLDPVAVSKIQILGSEYKGELLKQIPAENLPKQFGGNCECPGGCSMSDTGPWNEAR